MYHTRFDVKSIYELHVFPIPCGEQFPDRGDGGSDVIGRRALVFMVRISGTLGPLFSPELNGLFARVDPF